MENIKCFVSFQLGRRLVYHSKPPSANKQQLPLVNETKTKAQEEEYFFT